tara:strand:- start:9 stop:602 length:594 start_codon:yes stop_codon:yes gene_type:complete
MSSFVPNVLFTSTVFASIVLFIFLFSPFSQYVSPDVFSTTNLNSNSSRSTGKFPFQTLPSVHESLNPSSTFHSPSKGVDPTTTNVSPTLNSARNAHRNATSAVAVEEEEEEEEEEESFSELIVSTLIVARDIDRKTEGLFFFFFPTKAAPTRVDDDDALKNKADGCELIERIVLVVVRFFPTPKEWYNNNKRRKHYD